MEVKVKQKFRDKYTGDIRFTGEIVEMSEERYKEINAKKNGLVEKVEEKTEEVQTSEATKPEAGSSRGRSYRASGNIRKDRNTRRSSERVYQIYTRKDEGRRVEKESRRNGS